MHNFKIKEVLFFITNKFISVGIMVESQEQTQKNS